MKNLWQLGIYAEFQDSEFAHRVPHEILRLERIKMKFHTLPLLLALSLFATGCTRVVKEPVYIPQKCAIDMPLRPTPHTDTAINVRNVLIYTEQLERDLRFCIRGE